MKTNWTNEETGFSHITKVNTVFILEHLEEATYIDVMVKST